MLSQVLPNLMFIMMGNAIFVYLLDWLYENSLTKAEILNSADGIDLMGRILCVCYYKSLSVSL